MASPFRAIRIALWPRVIIPLIFIHKVYQVYILGLGLVQYVLPVLL